MAKSAGKSIEVKSENGRWSVRGAGGNQGSGKYSSKREATTAARKIAREQKLDVIIYEPGRKFTEIRTSDTKTERREKTTVANKNTAASVSSIREAQKSSPQKKAELWQEWAAGHKSNLPSLSDEAVSRESIYGDRG